jgi:hypothetical protein
LMPGYAATSLPCAMERALLDGSLTLQAKAA